MECCGPTYRPIDNDAKGVRSRRILWIVLLVVLLAAIAVGVVFIILWRLKDRGSDDIFDRIEVADLMKHLDQLQAFAVANGNNRAAGSAGFAASVTYVVNALKETDYNVTIQEFPYDSIQVLGTPSFEAASPAFNRPFTLQYGKDYLAIGLWERNTLLQGPLTYVTGCSDAAWQNFTAGDIALIQRGGCPFIDMSVQAANHSAQALIIFNSGNGTNNLGLFSARIGKSVPAFSATYAVGLSLSYNDKITVSIGIQTIVVTNYTMNILATTQQGRADRLVVVGSHLDSVPAGPGINDNGSGSALNLQLALLTYRYLASSLVNKVMFAWWGAEELGLLGSTFYVGNLTKNELSNIALNLNFDMVGSPNFFRGIYNGSSGNDAIRAGSTVIQNLFEDAFDIKNLPYSLTSFDGRSDYGPFIAQNISAGGLFTGAEGLKTVDQWRTTGGLANAAYDPCYHQFCDTTENINQEGYQQMSEAAARVLQRVALEPDLRAFLAQA